MSGREWNWGRERGRVYEVRSAGLLCDLQLGGREGGGAYYYVHVLTICGWAERTYEDMYKINSK